MANQRVAPGLPLPQYVDETFAHGALAPGVYVDQTIASGTNVNLTGVSGTGSVGSFTINADCSVNVTGVAGTGSVGTFVDMDSLTLVGVQGVGSVGTFSITGVIGHGQLLLLGVG